MLELEHDLINRVGLKEEWENLRAAFEAHPRGSRTQHRHKKVNVEDFILKANEDYKDLYKACFA